MRPTHTPRPKFDSLFADPGHFRGDCQLMRSAIRRGWLAGATDDDRAALSRRFEVACHEFDIRHPDGPNGQRLRGPWCRGLFAQISVGLAMGRDNATRQRDPAAGCE